MHGNSRSGASTHSGIAVGVDTGGTHTDFVLAGEGRLLTLKVPSTPDDLSRGILEGARRIVDMARLAMQDVGRFVYATTLVTNLIVEERDASVGLIATSGFRDILEIRRASRKPDVYDIHWRPARPLVPRQLRLTVRERVDHAGKVLVPLDEDDARAALCKLAAGGVRSIAVCLLHSYANPGHERRIAELAAEICPGTTVTLSSDVVREFREYERTSTTCVSAFIKGPIDHHLSCLETALTSQGLCTTPYIMRGNGGISTFDSARRTPAALAHSGPMGGIVGATALAARCGIENIVTLDMGGTSADVSLVSGGSPQLTNRGKIGAHPLLLPMLDLVTIGAGGGSVAWVDGSALRVGPRSAGSVPGPASYGQGGLEPTVTDANLLGGRLNPGYFLGGARQLEVGLARKALQERIARPLSMGLDEAALGIIAVAEAHMVNALRLVSVERGLDPRDFTLVAFGGAGPLHALRLAEALSVGRVLIPPAPGNLSAMGLVCADVRHDLTRTFVAELRPDIASRVEEVFAELLTAAGAALEHDRVEPSHRRYLLSVDLRYQGQNYELALPVTDLGADGMLALADHFHEQHQRVYGYRLSDGAVQIVNLRVTALGAMAHALWPEQQVRKGNAAASKSRPVLLNTAGWAEVSIYRIGDLVPNQQVVGPAIVEYPGSTLFMESGWQANFDVLMNAHVTRDGSGQPGPAATASQLC